MPYSTTGTESVKPLDPNSIKPGYFYNILLIPKNPRRKTKQFPLHPRRCLIVDKPANSNLTKIWLLSTEPVLFPDRWVAIEGLDTYAGKKDIKCKTSTPELFTSPSSLCFTHTLLVEPVSMRDHGEELKLDLSVDLELSGKAESVLDSDGEEIKTHAGNGLAVRVLNLPELRSLHEEYWAKQLEDNEGMKNISTTLETTRDSITCTHCKTQTQHLIPPPPSTASTFLLQPPTHTFEISTVERRNLSPPQSSPTAEELINIKRNIWRRGGGWRNTMIDLQKRRQKKMQTKRKETMR